MKLSQKQRIFTRNIGCLIEYSYHIDIELTFGHAWRSLEEQKRLKKEGKSKTLKSKHLDRLAVDFNFFINGKLTYDYHKIKPLGDYWESLHPDNRWGGDWNKNNKKDGFIDTPHFEMQ
ncbi:MAG: M15 family metallopeptidase [Psychroserpens sp.]|nr:M15 family metallopeptidase [Psychroserpens sp.]